MAGSATIGSLRVDLGINSAQFQQGVKQAQSTLGALGASFKQFAAGALAALSFGAITHAISSTIDHFDELGKASQKIGIPVEALSRLEYAAKLADVSFEQLSIGVGKLSKAMAGIAGGQGGDAGKALAAIGVSVVDAQGKLRSTEAVIGDIAEAFAGLNDGAGKTALAMAIFGKSGAELIPLLNEGKKGLADAAKEAGIFGQVVSGLSAKAAEQFNDNLTRLKTAASGLTAKFVTELLPSLVTLSERFVDFVKHTDIQSFFTDLSKYVAKTASEAQKLGIIVSVMMENFTKSDGLTLALERWKTGFAEIKKLNEGGGGISASADSISKMLDEIGNGPAPAKKDAPTFMGDAGPKKLSEAFLQSQFDAKQLNDAVLRLSQGFGTAGEAAQTLGQQMAQGIGAEVNGWLDDAISGTLDLKDALGGVLKSLTSMALNSVFFTLMNNAADPVTGGGFMGSVAKLFGFAKGGSFQVGGSGGVDSQLVAFKASPNERVSVSKPGEGMGGGTNVQVNVNNYGNDNVDVQRSDGPEGPRFDVVIGQMIDNHLASGRANKTMRGQFGLNPQKVRR